jgi:hypothetical protein
VWCCEVVLRRLILISYLHMPQHVPLRSCSIQLKGMEKKFATLMDSVQRSEGRVRTPRHRITVFSVLVEPLDHRTQHEQADRLPAMYRCLVLSSLNSETVKVRSCRECNQKPLRSVPRGDRWCTSVGMGQCDRMCADVLQEDGGRAPTHYFQMSTCARIHQNVTA